MVLDRLRRTDDGISITETIVAVVVLGVLMSVTASILISTLDVTRSNDRRVVAANLAQRQIESIQDVNAIDIPDGLTTSTETVGGTTFTIGQTANYASTTSDASICSDAAGPLAYKLVTATVTWDGMGTVEPVRADTVKAIGFGTEGLDRDTGVAAVEVQDAEGRPASGVLATLTPGAITRRTGIDGCAVFAGLSPSTPYAVTVSEPGYVGIDGSPAVVQAGINITEREVTRATVSYDRAGQLRVAVTSTAGYPVPAGVGLTLSTSLFTPTTRMAFPDCASVATSPARCVSGSPRAATALFPVSYGVWAGTCEDARPDASGDLVGVPRSGAATATVRLADLEVVVRQRSGDDDDDPSMSSAPVTEPVTVFASHAADAGCPSGESWTMSPSGTGTARVALPEGRWELTVDGYSGSEVVELTAGSLRSVVLDVS